MPKFRKSSLIAGQHDAFFRACAENHPKELRRNSPSFPLKHNAPPAIPLHFPGWRRWNLGLHAFPASFSPSHPLGDHYTITGKLRRNSPMPPAAIRWRACCPLGHTYGATWICGGFHLLPQSPLCGRVDCRVVLPKSCGDFHLVTLTATKSSLRAHWGICGGFHL